MGHRRVLVALGIALCGCTSVNLVQRSGCWVKQTSRWPGGTREELGFCARPPPAWSEDRVARLAQECMVQADYRWQNRAVDAWSHGQALPAQEPDAALSRDCVAEAAAALHAEAELLALHGRVEELARERAALAGQSEEQRRFLEQSQEKLIAALGDAARRPAPTATATATSNGTSKSEPAPPATTTVVGLPMAVASPARPAASAPAAPAKAPACVPRKPSPPGAAKAAAAAQECEPEATSRVASGTAR